jgi:hypothetical protein
MLVSIQAELGPRCQTRRPDGTIDLDDEGGEVRGIETGNISYCALSWNSAFWILRVMLSIW